MSLNFKNAFVTVLALWLLCSNPSLNQASENTFPLRNSFLQLTQSLEEIKKRLKRVADAGLREGRGELTSAGKQMLKDTIAGGAAKIFIQQDSEEKVKEAEANMRKLVARLLELGTKKTNGKIRIDEDTFVKAWKICPLYPFC